MMKNERKYITKQEAIEHFNNYYLPEVIAKYGKDDVIAIREEWSFFTDALCKDGAISPRQYDTWSNPF